MTLPALVLIVALSAFAVGMARLSRYCFARARAARKVHA